MSKKRCLVIGLDGGTWSVLDRFMDAGAMPNLKRLCGSGYRAELISTIPCITPTAWSSFATGMNPGKHGVFGFRAPQRGPGLYVPPVINRTTIAQPTLWRRLSDAGRKSIVLCVPVTYPPEPIEGCLVSGMFTPGVDWECTNPPELKDELTACGRMPRFELGITPKEALAGRQVERVEDAIRMTEELHRTVQYLRDRPWDFMMVVFIGTDRLQHTLWDRIVVGPRTDTALDRALRDFYVKLDGVIGEIVSHAGEDTVSMLMSDHGFGPRAGTFSVGRWLIEGGYARAGSRTLRSVVKRIAVGTGLAKVFSHKVSEKMRTRVLGEPLALDWDRTTIYPVSGARGFRVNLKGRENRGIVEPGEAFDSLRREIRDRILEAVDPVSGERVAQRAFFPEQIYHGEHLAWAPDVIIGPNEALGYDFLPGDPRDPRLSVPTPENSGGHRLAGMLLISGQNVRAVEGAPPAEIIDLAPTLMWLLGEPVPPEMDGCVLAEAFDAPLDGDVGRRSDGVQGDGVEANAAQEGRPSVTQRLKDLGYL